MPDREYTPFQMLNPLRPQIPEVMPFALSFTGWSQQAACLLTSQPSKATLLKERRRLRELIRIGEPIAIEQISASLDLEHIDTLPTSEAYILWLGVENHPDPKALPLAAHEYLALKGLLLMDEALFFFKHGNTELDRLRKELAGWDDAGNQTANQQHIESLLADAMEAVTFARCLLGKQLKQRQQATRGGKRRAQPFDQFKRWVKTKWEAHYQNLSNRKAARLLWKEAPDDFKELLNTDDPVGRLARWIGEFRKQAS